MNRLPEVYYQRRRVAAAVALVIVVLLVVAVIALLRPNKETEQAAVTSTVAATAEQTTAQETTVETTTQEAEETSTEETTTQAAAADGECSLADLQIEAQTNHANYPANSQPVFYMTVRNPTESDCVINLDENVMRFEVYAMDTNQRMWADVDCNPSVGEGEETFAAGSERYFEATWSRTNSAPGECSNRTPVPAGSYYLHTVIGDNPSAPATFNLQ